MKDRVYITLAVKLAILITITAFFNVILQGRIAMQETIDKVITDDKDEQGKLKIRGHSRRAITSIN